MTTYKFLSSYIPKQNLVMLEAAEINGQDQGKV
jgi:hypothetical protein